MTATEVIRDLPGEDGKREDLIDLLEANGYRHIRRLPTGELAAIASMVFTTGLFVGLDESGYRTRFCFESEHVARTALENWDGTGFPPGWWIIQKPEQIIGPAGKDRYPVS
jgi:hypothetical protein